MYIFLFGIVDVLLGSWVFVLGCLVMLGDVMGGLVVLGDVMDGLVILGDVMGGLVMFGDCLVLLMVILGYFFISLLWII